MKRLSVENIRFVKEHTKGGETTSYSVSLGNYVSDLRIYGGTKAALPKSVQKFIESREGELFSEDEYRGEAYKTFIYRR